MAIMIPLCRKLIARGERSLVSSSASSYASYENYAFNYYDRVYLTRAFLRKAPKIIFLLVGERIR